MKLIENEIKRKIKNGGSEEEKHLFKLGKNILSLVDGLYVGEKYREGWNSFYLLKTAFKDNVQRYNGIYLPYFQNTLNEIEEQERQALGYHLH